jgi:hypothetical protein
MTWQASSLAVADTRNIKHANDNRVTTLAHRHNEILSQRAGVKVDTEQRTLPGAQSPTRLSMFWGESCGYRHSSLIFLGWSWKGIHCLWGLFPFLLKSETTGFPALLPKKNGLWTNPASKKYWHHPVLCSWANLCYGTKCSGRSNYPPRTGALELPSWLNQAFC